MNVICFQKIKNLLHIASHDVKVDFQLKDWISLNNMTIIYFLIDI